jgi:hypothetical protein
MIFSWRTYLFTIFLHGYSNLGRLLYINITVAVKLCPKENVCCSVKIPVTLHHVGGNAVVAKSSKNPKENIEVSDYYDKYLNILILK